MVAGPEDTLTSEDINTEGGQNASHIWGLLGGLVGLWPVTPFCLPTCLLNPCPPRDPNPHHDTILCASGSWVTAYTSQACDFLDARCQN